MVLVDELKVRLPPVNPSVFVTSIYKSAEPVLISPHMSLFQIEGSFLCNDTSASPVIY